MSEVIEAVKEASISLACLLDDGEDIKLYTLEKDVEHIQNQITVIENFLEPFTNDQVNECLDCGFESTSFAELYNKKGDKITSWNKEDNVACPKCKSFNYFLKEKANA